MREREVYGERWEAEILLKISASFMMLAFGVFYFLEAFTSAIFMARTFKGRPKRVMKPLASWWS